MELRLRRLSCRASCAIGYSRTSTRDGSSLSTNYRRLRAERSNGTFFRLVSGGFLRERVGAWCAALVSAAVGKRATVALGAPSSATILTAGWLTESTAGVEVLLAGGKGKTLATIAAGQCRVARHVVDGSLET